MNRKKFEYHVIDTANTGVPLSEYGDDPYANRLAKGLNLLGSDGWELCAYKGTFIIFKREKK